MVRPKSVRNVPDLLTIFTISIQQVVIDAKGHLLGRLASIVAKALLNGE